MLRHCICVLMRIILHEIILTGFKKRNTTAFKNILFIILYNIYSVAAACVSTINVAANASVFELDNVRTHTARLAQKFYSNERSTLLIGPLHPRTLLGRVGRRMRGYHSDDGADPVLF